MNSHYEKANNLLAECSRRMVQGLVVNSTEVMVQMATVHALLASIDTAVIFENRRLTKEDK
jgi:hypothetical protein